MMAADPQRYAKDPRHTGGIGEEQAASFDSGAPLSLPFSSPFLDYGDRIDYNTQE